MKQQEQEILKSIEKQLEDARQVLLKNNVSRPIELILIKSFYYFADKEWWKHYLLGHQDLVVKFIDVKKNIKFRLYSDGEIYQEVI